METQNVLQEVINENEPVVRKEEVESIENNFIQYLTFKVGNETYGIDINSVKEVIEYSKVFPIPRIPSYIRGVTNLRGEVIPVIDLNSRFYGQTSEITILTGIVFIEVQYKGKIIMLGIIIDQVDAVTRIYENDIDSFPEFGAKIRYDFISNIGKVDENFIILLNIERVLDVDELASFKLKREEETGE